MAFAAGAEIVLSLLQRNAYASKLGQGCSPSPPRTEIWYNCQRSNPVGTTPLLRSDIIFGRHTPFLRRRWILEQRCCCSWCWAGNGCCCQDWFWRRFLAWGCFHSGCWWSGQLLSWALLGRILNGTDEPHHPDLAQRNVADCAGGLPALRRR